MNKLKVGMYYRYKEVIGKYIKSELGSSYFTNQNKYGWHEIANGGKFSYNIIDLIEVGDYVNGMKVTMIAGTYHGRKDKAIYCEHNGDENWKQVMIYDDEIKSIVTKEQFESMKYNVGDSNE